MGFFPDRQTFVSFDLFGLHFDIRWYAVLILTGVVLVYFITRRDIKKARYIDLDWYDSLFVYTLWAGVIGARLWYCAFYNFSYYFSHPSSIIRVWDGGLAIQGALVGGALFMWFYVRKYHYSFMKILDICLPDVLLGQAIGRWGNYVNQECHGGEVDPAYFDGILSFLKDGMCIDGHYYEPLFFYESLLCLLGFVLIYFILRRHQNKRGDLAYAYLMWYGVIRFFIEGKRTDSLYLGNIKMAQLTSLVFLVVGLLGYLNFFQKYLIRKKPTLIFDFDGTLVDTSESIIESYHELFKKYSSEDKFTDEIRNEVIGPALKELFPKYFPGVDYDTLYEDYHNAQIEIAKRTNHPTEHAEETLKALHDEGYHIGIVSTRSNEGIRDILTGFAMEGYVDDICGVWDVEKVKPDPEGIFKLVSRNGWYRECVMIGDSLADMDCGLNYGAYRVAYLDREDRAEQMKAAANVAISDLAELPEILDRDISFTYDEK